MPDRPDFNKSRRPPPRRSWEEPEESQDYKEQDGSGYGRFRDSAREVPGSQSRPGRPGARGAGDARSGSRDSGRSRGSAANQDEDEGDYTPIQSMSSGWGGKQALSREEKAERDRNNNRRLKRMLAMQAICLTILFSCIAGYNWMANDESGDYLGQSPDLRTVRLSITRHGASSEAHLSYGALGVLELDDSTALEPQSEQAISLNFSTPKAFQKPGERVWYANFTGHIDNGQAVGTLTDATGEYKVSLNKNVLTSIFGQAQGRMPHMQVWTPSFFNEDNAKPLFDSSKGRR